MYIEIKIQIRFVTDEDLLNSSNGCSSNMNGNKVTGSISQMEFVDKNMIEKFISTEQSIHCSINEEQSNIQYLILLIK